MAKQWTKKEVQEGWVDRPFDSHKGSNGRIGIIAGSETMPGAAVLASKAAVNTGAGLTTLNTVRSVVPIVASHVAEVTFFLRENHLSDFLDGKDVIAAGPGLGRGPEHQSMIETLIYTEGYVLILDADALYWISELKSVLKNRQSPVVITPHAGEMARITGTDMIEIERNRIETAIHVSKDFNVYTVLKGPKTVTVSPEGDVIINTSGNAGLAKGGSGDVLTGMLTSFLARYENILEGTAAAVYMHGYTADYLSEHDIDTHTMTPAMLTDTFQQSFNSINR